MWAEKTTRVMTELGVQASFGKTCLYINHGLDNRSSEAYSTHNAAIKLPATVSCIKTADLASVNVDDYQIIAIDEAQFFDETLISCVRRWVEAGKTVYVAGLHADSTGQKFGHVLDLIPFADYSKQLRAWCQICQDRHACFTKRIDNTKEQINVGDAHSYQPVCRRHFVN